MQKTTPYMALISEVFDFTNQKYIKNIFLVLIGSVILFLSSKFRVHIGPVPFSMQTLAVLLLGCVLGWKLGVLTVFTYLFEGALGLPVFAGTPEKGIGLAYMMGPTGGYLVGFLLGAGITGFLAERGWDRNCFWMVIAMLLGNIAIYVPGLLWLGNFVGYSAAIEFGFLPFLLGELLKLLIAALLTPYLWKIVLSRKDNP